MASLTEREVAILRVLAEPEHERMYAGRIGYLAGFKRTTRLDTGTANTLRALERKGLVNEHLQPAFQIGTDRIIGLGSTKWSITDEGHAALSEFAFGE